MNRNKQTIDNPRPSAGNEKIKVYISFCSPLNLLNILNSLVIRSTLKILAICGSIDKALDCDVLAPVYPSIISNIEAITTKKSKIFHPKKKYALLKAINFNNISIINMILKPKFMLFNIVCLFALWSSSLRIITTILSKIHRVIPSSKGFHVTIL
jgi:hypothetical protein